MTEKDKELCQKIFDEDMVANIEKNLDEDLSKKLFEAIVDAALKHGNGKGNTHKTFVSLAHAVSLVMIMFTKMAKDQDETYDANVQQLGKEFEDFLDAFYFLADHPDEETQN